MFIYIHDTIKNTAVLVFAIRITKLITIKLCQQPGRSPVHFKIDNIYAKYQIINN